MSFDRRELVLSGIIGVALIIGSYATGLSQPLEWRLFDTFLRLRPQEEADERITIIGITDQDLESTRYPITDQKLAEIIQTVEIYEPRAIGIDIYRGNPVSPGTNLLNSILETNPKVIGLSDILYQPQIKPPEALPPEQVGSASLIGDDDKNFRRDLLAFTYENTFQVGMTVRLVELYLSPIEFHVGSPQYPVLELGEKTLPLFNKNTGAYVKGEDSGTQTLINPRSGPQPFEVISLSALERKNFNPEIFQDRIVLIGMTALTVKTMDYNAVGTLTPNLVHSVEFRAHAVSQMLSAYEDGRPLIWGLSEPLELLFPIVISALLGYIYYRFLESIVVRNYVVWISLIVSIVIPLVTSYLLLRLLSLWIPVLPFTLLIFSSSAIAYGTYLEEKKKQDSLAERSQAIDEAFDNLHAGPLQLLSRIQRSITEDGWSENNIVRLDTLNVEMRRLREILQPRNDINFLLMGEEISTDGEFHQILEEVWSLTSSLLGDGLKISQIIKGFEPMDAEFLTAKEKKECCLFLYEAICNASKHAENATRLKVFCGQQKGKNIIRVEDNGNPLHTTQLAKPIALRRGGGTLHAERLAQKLKGRFERGTIHPHGCFCEIRWESHMSWTQQLSRKLKGF